MPREVQKVDELGIVLNGQQIILQDNELCPVGYINVKMPDGMYIQKWDGSKWVEGKTQEEIEAIKNIVLPKTELELAQEQIVKLQQINEATSTDFQGFMDLFFATHPELA